MGEPPGYHRRLLGREDGVAIWRVDGHRVRDTLDVEFTNGHHHLTRRYVPRDEIWLDRDAPGSGEWMFWARHQLVQRAAMERGEPYLRALAIANRAERAERRAAGEPGPADRAQVLRTVRRRPMGKTGGKEVWLVDGRAVRSALYQDFTLGGHALRYRFIPRREIWIDDAVSPSERPAILCHELVEIERMQRGLDYWRAHALASRAERRFRRLSPRTATR